MTHPPGFGPSAILPGALAAALSFFGSPAPAARAATSAAAPFAAAPANAPLAVAQSAANEIRFAVSVAGSKGHVLCGLFRKNGWLKSPAMSQSAAIHGGEAECVFSGAPPDTYAVSAFHDENDNGRLDTNFLGIPTESWCASRDAKGLFGPPSFEDANFRYQSGVLRLRASAK